MDSDDDGEEWQGISKAGEPAPAQISMASTSAQPALGADVGDWFVERAKYIPLRLALDERKLLRLLEAGLAVSEYTDVRFSSVDQAGVDLV